MHQHPGCPLRLWLCQLRLDKIGSVHPHQIGRRFARLGNGSFHPLKPHSMFGPDIGLEPQRLGRIGQVHRGDIAALGRDDLDGVIGRRIAFPFGRKPHCTGLWPDFDPAQIIVVPRQHQIDPRAGADFQAVEPRAQTTLRQPQHRADEVGRPPRFIGLRRSIQPRQQRRLMLVERASDDCGIIHALRPVIDLGQRRLDPAQMERMKPARDPQRQRISQRRARPMPHRIEDSPACPSSQQLQQASTDPRGDRRIGGPAIGDLVCKGGKDCILAARVDVDVLILVAHRLILALCPHAA